MHVLEIRSEYAYERKILLCNSHSVLTGFLAELNDYEAKYQSNGKLAKNESFQGFYSDKSDEDGHQGFHFQLQEQEDG